MTSPVLVSFVESEALVRLRSLDSDFHCFRSTLRFLHRGPSPEADAANLARRLEAACEGYNARIELMIDCLKDFGSERGSAPNLANGRVLCSTYIFDSVHAWRRDLDLLQKRLAAYLEHMYPSEALPISSGALTAGLTDKYLIEFVRWTLRELTLSAVLVLGTSKAETKVLKEHFQIPDRSASIRRGDRLGVASDGGDVYLVPYWVCDEPTYAPILTRELAQNVLWEQDDEITSEVLRRLIDSSIDALAEFGALPDRLVLESIARLAVSNFFAASRHSDAFLAAAFMEFLGCFGDIFHVPSSVEDIFDEHNPNDIAAKLDALGGQTLRTADASQLISQVISLKVAVNVCRHCRPAASAAVLDLRDQIDKFISRLINHSNIELYRVSDEPLELDWPSNEAFDSGISDELRQFQQQIEYLACEIASGIEKVCKPELELFGQLFHERPRTRQSKHLEGFNHLLGLLNLSRPPGGPSKEPKDTVFTLFEELLSVRCPSATNGKSPKSYWALLEEQILQTSNPHRLLGAFDGGSRNSPALVKLDSNSTDSELLARRWKSGREQLLAMINEQNYFQATSWESLFEIYKSPKKQSAGSIDETYLLVLAAHHKVKNPENAAEAAPYAHCFGASRSLVLGRFDSVCVVQLGDLGEHSRSLANSERYSSAARISRIHPIVVNEDPLAGGANRSVILVYLRRHSARALFFSRWGKESATKLGTKCAFSLFAGEGGCDAVISVFEWPADAILALAKCLNDDVFVERTETLMNLSVLAVSPEMQQRVRFNIAFSIASAHSHDDALSTIVPEIVAFNSTHHTTWEVRQITGAEDFELVHAAAHPSHDSNRAVFDLIQSFPEVSRTRTSVSIAPHYPDNLGAN
jgi:hypothetical protein